MKFTLSQIAAAAGAGGLDGNEVMHDLLILGTHNGGTPTLREYFCAHAPEHPQPWFRPDAEPCPDFDDPTTAEASRAVDAWRAEVDRQRWLQWPTAWADEQLRILTEKRRDEARKR